MKAFLYRLARSVIASEDRVRDLRLQLKRSKEVEARTFARARAAEALAIEAANSQKNAETLLEVWRRSFNFAPDNIARCYALLDARGFREKDLAAAIGQVLNAYDSRGRLLLALKEKLKHSATAGILRWDEYHLLMGLSLEDEYGGATGNDAA